MPRSQRRDRTSRRLRGGPRASRSAPRGTGAAAHANLDVAERLIESSREPCIQAAEVVIKMY